MLGHGSAITTAYNVTCLPTLGATNNGFPKFVSIVRLSEDDIDTEDISEGKKKRRHKLSYSYHVIVCMRVGGGEWEGGKVAEKEGTRKTRGRKGEREWDGGMPLLGSRTCRAHEC